VTEYSDVPERVMRELGARCGALPEVEEQQAWAGSRWVVRKRTFAHVLTIEGPHGPDTVMTFRSSGDELGVLHHAGHPFFRPGWGTNVVGMVLDDDTDWDEVGELVTESYCLLAPKKLAALVERPDS
jgi:predicted DNA-binding protein (MmcQ/YjbR family)